MLLRAGLLAVLAMSGACGAPSSTSLPRGFNVEQHAAVFPIDQTAVHALDKVVEADVVTCAACHAPEADTFSDVQCTSCHAHAVEVLAPTHAYLTNYAWESPQCLECHPTGVSPRDGNIVSIEGHAGFFPIDATSSHAEVACGACHAQMPTVWSDNACATCHLDTTPQLATLHSGMRGYVATSTGCKQCHAEGRVERVDDHRPFVITSGEHRTRCTNCHTTTRADKDWAVDFAEHTCLRCHSENGTNNDHRGEDGYVAYDVPRCISCHPDGRE